MITGDAGTFGARLREARVLKGLSQGELGGEEYSASYISHLENGRREPNEKALQLFAERLGVQPEDLLAASGTANQPRFSDLDNAISELYAAESASTNQDWQTVMVHAQAAQEAADRIGDPGRSWQAQYLLARAKFHSGQYIEAADLAVHISEQELSKRLPIARTQSLILASLGYRSGDRFGWAIINAARALEAGPVQAPGSDADLRAEALIALVSAIYEAGLSSAESAPYLEELRGLIDKVNSDHQRGVIRWALGTAAFLAGDAKECLHQFELVKDLLDPNRDLRMWFRYHSTLARLRLELGIPGQVEDLLKVAESGFRIFGNIYDRVELRQLQARHALVNGDPESAKRIALELLEDPEVLGQEIALGQSQLLVAQSWEALGQEALAREWYGRAARRFEKEERLGEATRAWRKSVGEPTVDPE